MYVHPYRGSYSILLTFQQPFFYKITSYNNKIKNSYYVYTFCLSSPVQVDKKKVNLNLHTKF